MNSVFLNYSTSYFDLLNTDALLPSYSSNKLIKSFDGKLVESDVSLDSGGSDEQFYTNKTTLGFGERRAFNPDFKNISLGYSSMGYLDLNCNIYPTTTLHSGLKFTQNATKYNNSDLWVNNFNVLQYRDRAVASVDNIVSPIVGNIPVFGNNVYGALNDSGMAITDGFFVLTLSTNDTNPNGTTVDIDFNYQKIGKFVNLTLRKTLFQGNIIGKPPGFETQIPAGLLPVDLRPAFEVSCPIMIYQQSGSSTNIINQVGILKIGGDIIGNVNAGNVEIIKDPQESTRFDADTGNFDGWSSTTITYFTN